VGNSRSSVAPVDPPTGRYPCEATNGTHTAHTCVDIVPEEMQQTITLLGYDVSAGKDS
jgi:hypothetical protein